MNKNKGNVYIMTHLLTKHGANRLNTGEVNEAKTMNYGGAIRPIISGGKFRNGVRKQFESYTSEQYGNTYLTKDPSDKLIENIGKKYKNKTRNQILSEVDNLIFAINSVESNSTKTQQDDSEQNANKTQDKEIKVSTLNAPLLLSDNELRLLADLAFKYKIEDKKEAKKLKEEIKTILKNNLTPTELIFGRMLAGSHNVTINGCFETGIEFTTHESLPDSDFYRCVDMLRESTGAAMIGNQDFGSGVYFRSTAFIPNVLFEKYSKQEAINLIKMFLNSVIEPDISGGNARYMTNTKPENIFMTVLMDRETPLEGAFETPVSIDDAVNSGNGLMKSSIQKMIDYFEYQEKMYEFKYLYKGASGKNISEICQKNEYQVEENISSLVNHVGDLVGNIICNEEE